MFAFQLTRLKKPSVFAGGPTNIHVEWGQAVVDQVQEKMPDATDKLSQ